MQRDKNRIHGRVKKENYLEFQLRRNMLDLTVDKFLDRILDHYFKSFPREDFEFPKGY